MSGKPTHGESRTPEYRAWQCARHRCTQPSNPAWSRYGGRGITICERWANDVEAFISDMGRKPSPAHELDRIDNDRGYEPENCRWAVRKVNARNRETNRVVRIGDEEMTLAAWCERTGLPRSTVSKRLAAGWPASKALSEPVGPSGPKPKACARALMADAAP